MAKVWVKGYTKPDGTRVKGHYRDVASKARQMESSGTVKKDRYGLFAAKGTGIPISDVSENSPKAYQLMARYNRIKVNSDAKRTWNEMIKTPPGSQDRRALNQAYSTLTKLRRRFKK
jgi:hypothetical protein